MPAHRDQPRWSIEDILERINLDDLLDQLAEPATSSRPRRWHCPVPGHDDHHASVSTHTDARGHQRWRCWSGDDTHRGDAIDLVTITQGLNARDAIAWLAEHVGLHRDDNAAPRRPRPTRPSPPPPAVMPLAPTVVDYVHDCAQRLWTPAGHDILDWLTNTRGFAHEVLRANHVGADPGRARLPRAPGLPVGRGSAATFPALDPNGQIRYVQARYLHPDTGHKYDNPASRLGTNPRLAWTQPATPTATRPDVNRPAVLFVCEGIPDALTAAQAGHLAVAILGAQAPDTNVATRLAHHAHTANLELIAIIDADPAGRTWGQRLADLLAEHDQALTIVEPPADGLDLNSWAAQDPTWHTTLPVAALPTTARTDERALDAIHPTHTPIDMASSVPRSLDGP